MNMRHRCTAAGVAVEVVVGNADERLDKEEDDDDSTEYSMSGADIAVELSHKNG